MLFLLVRSCLIKIYHLSLQSTEATSRLRSDPKERKRRRRDQERLWQRENAVPIGQIMLKILRLILQSTEATKPVEIRPEGKKETKKENKAEGSGDGGEDREEKSRLKEIQDQQIK